jgi:hypothetical protein
VIARALAAAALVAALAGCGLNSALNSHLKPAPTPGLREGEWAAVRAAATRRGSIYDALEHRASVTATYLGPTEREARARRLGEWFGWTQEELERRLKQERAEAAQGEEFLIAFYTADGKSNDLDALQSIWRIAVEVDEGEIVASKVEALVADATITALFPYVGGFDTVYRVRFPPPPSGPLAGRMFAFEMSSAYGRIDLGFGNAGALPGPDRPLEHSSDR